MTPLDKWDTVDLMHYTLLAFALTGLLHATQAPSLRLGAVRSIHIAGYDTELLGPDKQIATCVMDKLKAQGPFTFPAAKAGADAVLTLESSIPTGSTRVIWGRSPQVKATLTSTAGDLLWAGDNKYKKSTTVWGSSSDIPCGLANGLVNKLVKAIDKDSKANQ